MGLAMRVVRPCNGPAGGRDSDYVSMRQHPSYHGRASRTAPKAEDQQTEPQPEAVYTPAARHSGRACCCAAPPAVIVVLPPATGRPAATDLLLCGHHYRASLRALAARGAMILDASGHPLASGAWPDPV
jgi:hypothetical protein